MNAQSLPTARFIRKTQLGAGEYRKNFHQIDQDIIAAITSPEADAVTPLISKIYLRLVNAPAQYWERTGVLRFEAEVRENRQVKAWLVFCEVAGVASATAHKALTWLHEQGIIGYFSGKNGVGLRIFLNRASTSIGTRTASGNKKILQFGRASSVVRPASTDETAFNDSYAVKEIQDTDLSSAAPENGADTMPFNKLTSTPPAPDTRTAIRSAVEPHEVTVESTGAQHIDLGEIIARLKSELEPGLRSVAAQVAAQATRSEIERTRTWFETKALPKAVRVAQSECYGLLKKLGSLDEKSQRLRAGLDVGRHVTSEVVETARPRTPREISETAEVCLALLETQGQSIEITLSEISADEGGGWLLPEDAPRVRAAAELMLAERERRN
jgi:hypothetical protein